MIECAIRGRFSILIPVPCRNSDRRNQESPKKITPQWSSHTIEGFESKESCILTSSIPIPSEDKQKTKKRSKWKRAITYCVRELVTFVHHDHEIGYGVAPLPYSCCRSSLCIPKQPCRHERNANQSGVPFLLANGGSPLK